MQIEAIEWTIKPFSTAAAAVLTAAVVFCCCCCSYCRCCFLLLLTVSDVRKTSQLTAKEE